MLPGAWAKPSFSELAKHFTALKHVGNSQTLGPILVRCRNKNYSLKEPITLIRAHVHRAFKARNFRNREELDGVLLLMLEILHDLSILEHHIWADPPP